MSSLVAASQSKPTSGPGSGPGPGPGPGSGSSKHPLPSAQMSERNEALIAARIEVGLLVRSDTPTHRTPLWGRGRGTARRIRFGELPAHECDLHHQESAGRRQHGRRSVRLREDWWVAPTPLLRRDRTMLARPFVQR
ncbi:MAG: hypothetical protein GWO22_10120, partial [Actinobacteria bacterium]|nr:hypothetical protein [Actinomycetota bacterium]NIV55358.1 hypothetical protein [Actinomycetota bacterium]